MGSGGVRGAETREVLVTGERFQWKSHKKTTAFSFFGFLKKGQAVNLRSFTPHSAINDRERSSLEEGAGKQSHEKMEI